MSTQDPFGIETLLLNPSYELSDVMARGIASQSGLSQGQILSLLIVYGHLELAKALVDTGVVPERGPQCHPYRTPNPHDKKRLSLLSMILEARGYGHFNHYDSSSSMKRSTWEVLDYILDKGDIWPIGLNEICEFHQATPLMQVDSYYEEEHKQKRHRLMQMLVDAGADINLHTAKDNATRQAMQCRKNIQERAFEEELAFLTKLGFDKTQDSHITLARAIETDALFPEPSDVPDQPGALARTLLDAGIELTAPVDCPREVNPFCQAIEWNAPHWIMRLLDAGLDPGHIDPDTGNTLFSEAAHGKDYSVKALCLIPDDKLRHVANHQNKKGDTPLHHAVASLSLPLVQKLIACGADPNALNKKKQLPLQTVRRTSPKTKQKLDAIIECLDGAGAEISAHELPAVFNQACRALAGDLVKKLIKQGADVNGVDKSGMTPLLVLAKHSKNYFNEKQKQAARQSYEDILGALLGEGADINARDKKGNTALHYAVMNNSPVMVEALLRCGVDTNALNKKKMAPAHMWHDKWGGWVDDNEEALEIVKAFTAHGFNPRLQGPNGEEPFALLEFSDVLKTARAQWDLSQNTQTTATAPAPSRRARL